MLRGLINVALRPLLGRDLAVWYTPLYRLPLPSLEARTGFGPRRADHAVWYLLEQHAISTRNLRAPRRAEYAELSRVHTPELLESLSHAETLAAVWSVSPGDVRVDEVMTTVRLACGATIDAAREVLTPASRLLGRRALNLLGGFHHAGPGSAGGFCPVNDLAVAVAALRADGFLGRIAVLDLDAHPPDGTAQCLRTDPNAWIGSISGVDWGWLPGVDETVLPKDAGDETYLAALDALLRRMPAAELVFVCAGGDVLEGDPLGLLHLTLDGARSRDLRVAEALGDTPSVWLPSGGYSEAAWRALAGTGLALSLRTRRRIPRRYDPLVSRFSAIARTLGARELGAETLDMDDVAADLGLRPRSRRLLLGFYSTEGLEHALERYGILAVLRRLGYGPFRAELQAEGIGESARLVDVPSGQALIEVVLEKRKLAGHDVLYVHWLALRHPKGRFSTERPRLPGQDVPGLGLGQEITELLARMALRLGCDGVAFRPAAYHLAWRGREVLRFVDPVRQGEFEALVRDLAGLPLLEATRAIAEGRVLRNGEPWQWQPDEMVRFLQPPPGEDRAAVDAARAAVTFTVQPDPAAPASAHTAAPLR